MKNFDTLVIGGGVAGLSTAYHLAKQGEKSVLVVERENALGGHASGRNAGMIRQAIADPLLARLACRGRNALASLKARQWPGLGFKVNGSMLLADGPKSLELSRTQANLKRLGVASVYLSRSEASKRVSILEGGKFDQALFCPSDAFLDIQALLRNFARNIQRQGVSLEMSSPIRRIEPRAGGFRVETARREFFCGRIVNAAGAWALPVAHRAGASCPGLVPYQRHLFWSRSFGAAAKHWPFVWHTSQEFYFRPDQGGLMLSACDKTPFGNEKTDPKVRRLLIQKLGHFSSRWLPMKFYKVQAGLRTLVPDGRFVIGPDRTLKNFYWVAALGGHGVTTCFSVGQLASDIILGKAKERDLVEAFSPGRLQS